MRIAIYAGSFDPITRGHEDIMMRSLVFVFVPFALIIATRSSVLSGGILNLLFEVALVALLLHPMSRDYQRIWFK